MLADICSSKCVSHSLVMAFPTSTFCAKRQGENERTFYAVAAIVIDQQRFGYAGSTNQPTRAGGGGGGRVHVKDSSIIQRVTHKHTHMHKGGNVHRGRPR